MKHKEKFMLLWSLYVYCILCQQCTYDYDTEHNTSA